VKKSKGESIVFSLEHPFVVRLISVAVIALGLAVTGQSLAKAYATPMSLTQIDSNSSASAPQASYSWASTIIIENYVPFGTMTYSTTHHYPSGVPANYTFDPTPVLDSNNISGFGFNYSGTGTCSQTGPFKVQCNGSTSSLNIWYRYSFVPIRQGNLISFTYPIYASGSAVDYSASLVAISDPLVFIGGNPTPNPANPPTWAQPNLLGGFPIEITFKDPRIRTVYLPHIER
jgi:hypothetical protein